MIKIDPIDNVTLFFILFIFCVAQVLSLLIVCSYFSESSELEQASEYCYVRYSTLLDYTNCMGELKTQGWFVE